MKIIDYSKEIDYEIVNDLYVLKKSVYMDVDFGTGHVFRIKIDKGAMSDGLSVPKIFRWYLPCWDDKNVLYNLIGLIHDGAYGSQCLGKDVADELFYTGLVMAGISKTKAKVAEWAVQNLAGLHYGRENDDYGISEYVSIEAV